MPNPNTTAMFYIQQKYLMKSYIVFEGAFHNLKLSGSQGRAIAQAVSR
jgi:hypothetical protein